MKKTGLALAIILTITTSSCATHSPQEQGAEGSRTVSEVMDDNNIEATVETRIQDASPDFRRARIRAIAYHGKVLLVGQVSSADLINVATREAYAVRRVNSVHNELTTGAPISAKVKANDSWQAMKVKSRMFTASNFPSRSINIIVENGVVYLMGSVTPDIATRAGQLAAEVGGVQKVVLLFESAQEEN